MIHSKTLYWIPSSLSVAGTIYCIVLAYRYPESGGGLTGAGILFLSLAISLAGLVAIVIAASRLGSKSPNVEFKRPAFWLLIHAIFLLAPWALFIFRILTNPK